MLNAYKLLGIFLEYMVLKKTSVTLEEEVYNDLCDLLTDHKKETVSSIVNEALKEALPDIKELLKQKDLSENEMKIKILQKKLKDLEGNKE